MARGVTERMRELCTTIYKYLVDKGSDNLFLLATQILSKHFPLFLTFRLSVLKGQCNETFELLNVSHGKKRRTTMIQGYLRHHPPALSWRQTFPRWCTTSLPIPRLSNLLGLRHLNMGGSSTNIDSGLKGLDCLQLLSEL